MKPQFLILLFLFPTLLAQSQTTKVKTINGRIVDPIDLMETSRFNINCDTVFSFSTVDQDPIGLAFDGINFYSGGYLRDMIYKYDLNGQLTDSIPYPGNDVFAGNEVVAGGIDFDGTFLWVVSEQERRIYKLNPMNGDTIISFILPSSDFEDPDNWGCAYDNGYIWTTEYQDRTLMRINATTGALVDSFFINREILPLKIINGELYGIEYLDGPSENYQLVKFDKSSGTALDSIPWCLLKPLGLTWAENYVWGLSSGFDTGTSRIYEFGNLLSSNKNVMSSNRLVTVFPNPASNQVTISSPGPIQWIEFYTVMGKKVFAMPGMYQTMHYDIDLSGFQKGITIRIFDGLGFHGEKIVVQ